jgi:hypothetical protein
MWTLNESRSPAPYRPPGHKGFRHHPRGIQEVSGLHAHFGTGLAVSRRALLALVALAALLVPAAADAADATTAAADATTAAVRGAPVAGAVPTSDLLMVHDASEGAEPMGGWERYARFRVSGDPRVSPWPEWYQGLIPGVSRTAKMDALTANARNVARTICDVRGYCGRLGWKGYHPSGGSTVLGYLPWHVLGNDPVANDPVDGDSRSDHFGGYVTIADEDIMEGDGDPNQPSNDWIAHEFGHLMDKEYAGNRSSSQNLEGNAVEEALADMFAYDYDWGDPTIGEDASGVARNWANPGAIMRDGQPYPAHMDQYDDTPPDNAPHFNSTILSHAYYLFVQRVGRTKAGRVLHNVPQGLSPRPTFQQVRRSFSQSAHVIYGGTLAAHANAAFAAVGLAPPSHQEPDCGPQAC